MQKIISDIFAHISTLEVIGATDCVVEKLAFDSREVVAGTLFFALKGTQTDGHKFIEKAIEQGASAIVYQDVTQNQTYKHITYIRVADTAVALAHAAAEFYEHPSEKLKLVGVTGTNGKTTIATLLHKLFLAAGHKAGLISTVKNFINTKAYETKHTTPDVLTFNRLLSEMINEGCEYCFAEVSSHAVVQNRVEGLKFVGGIFTNLTHDHLDYHQTFAEYLKAKKLFFDKLPKNAFTLTNIDDKNGRVMLQNTAASQHTYGLKNFADFKIKVLETHFDGMLSELNHKEVWTILTGDFNAYNIVAVYAAAELLGLDSEYILQIISSLQPVKGRFDILNKNGKTAIVDYAHTPDALKNVLSTIDKIREPEQNIITVAGAGGDRDKTKRPVMARTAAEWSNRLILTSDNPRTENPETILHDMESGLSEIQRQNTLKITNREDAIKTALMLAQRGDIVLIAGKGHEDYQEINGTRSHFDDKEIAEKYM